MSDVRLRQRRSPSQGGPVTAKDYSMPRLGKSHLCFRREVRSRLDKTGAGCCVIFDQMLWLDGQTVRCPKEATHADVLSIPVSR
jgi:hypothetical protein